MRFTKTNLLNTLLNFTLVFVALLSSFSTAHAGFSKVIGSSVKLIPTTGTTSFYQGVTWQGTTRSVLFIRPTTLPAGKSAAIVMLHYDTGTPELMANLTRAGNLVAKMGYWVILPPAINGHWHDDPADTATTSDDVGFLTTLIQTATSQYPIDATRVSMAGMSNGGFMTTRMACEQSQLIASGIVVAAEMRTSLANICHPSRPVPMAFVMGTTDPIVNYNGGYAFISAPNSFGMWTGYSSCDSSKTSTQNLPITVNDTTSVTLQHNAACTSLGEADLYTVTNGGHAWPGGNYTLGCTLGIASQNLDATTMLGNFAKLWTTQSTV